MGTKERRAKEKEALKNTILLEARRILDKQGWQQITVRKIAEAIEYSVPTMYEFFENKDDLLNALRAQGYQILCSMVEERLNKVSTPADILFAIAQGYWDFAWKHIELYKLMCGLENSFDDGTDTKVHIAHIRTMVQQALSSMLSSHKKKMSDAWMRDKMDSMRSIIHGFVALALAKSIERNRAQRLMMQALEDSVVVCL